MSDSGDHLGGTSGGGIDLPGRWRRIEIWKPPTDGIRGYMWVEIIDDHGPAPDNIIKRKHPWRVRCHVVLYGDIWKCVCGTMCLDMCFSSCGPVKKGEPTHYQLKDMLPRGRLCRKFVGCKWHKEGKDGKEGYVEFELEDTVPPKQLPVGEDGRPTAYEWTATLSFQNRCGEYETIAGFQTGEMAVHKG